MNRGKNYISEDRRQLTNRIQKRRYRIRTGSGYGKHQWTAEEEERVVTHAVPDRELAEQIGVSVQAITVKRWRLNNLTLGGKP